jgi:hypothetical protein
MQSADEDTKIEVTAKDRLRNLSELALSLIWEEAQGL